MTPRDFIDPDVDPGEGGELTEEDLRILAETGLAQELERQIDQGLPDNKETH